ncbi:hypothetical protein E2C01_024534 [Portunus trituberculatus]|uniref:Uncharacterized protein n=1 Tax=Portunus trituberculatus TaxID=210409 RepID=A0A5B7EAJ8_PORTR|nr:hypothetical protein [Portunus trituberculatus]
MQPATPPPFILEPLFMYVYVLHVKKAGHEITEITAINHVGGHVCFPPRTLKGLVVMAASQGTRGALTPTDRP